jgi:hypothetical protein
MPCLKLVLEREHPTPGLERDPEVGQQRAHAEGDQDPERRAAGQRGEKHEREAAARHQVDELDRAQRHVCPLELQVHLLPEPAMAEGLLGDPKEAGEGGEALALLASPGTSRPALEVGGKTALDPRAGAAGEREARRGEDDEGDDQGEDEPAERGVEGTREASAVDNRRREAVGDGEVLRVRPFGLQ